MDQVATELDDIIAGNAYDMILGNGDDYISGNLAMTDLLVMMNDIIR